MASSPLVRSTSSGKTDGSSSQTSRKICWTMPETGGGDGRRGTLQVPTAPADDLSSLEDASVDIVTTRSVLIYVEDKRRAFEEFFRVLKPGGRIFEPINRFNTVAWSAESGLYMGCDVNPVKDLAVRVQAIYERIQPRETDPMLNFDERDLLIYAEEAGFEEIHSNTGQTSRRVTILLRRRSGLGAPAQELREPQDPHAGRGDERSTEAGGDRTLHRPPPPAGGAQREQRDASAVAYLWAKSRRRPR